MWRGANAQSPRPTLESPSQGPTSAARNAMHPQPLDPSQAERLAVAKAETAKRRKQQDERKRQALMLEQAASKVRVRGRFHEALNSPASGPLMLCIARTGTQVPRQLAIRVPGYTGMR